MSAGGGYYDKPPVEIATDDITKASSMLKLVNLTIDDYAFDGGRYKRLWNVTFQLYDNVRYQYQIINGHTTSVPSADRTGYHFIRWVANNSTWNTSSEITDHIVIAAEYEKYVFDVIIDANGGSNSSDTTMEYGSVLYEPETSRSGNVLDGWYYTANCENHNIGEQVVFPITVTGDLSIKAEWNVTVTFTSNNTTYSSSTIRSGTTISQPNDPSRTGYNFDYWTLNNQQFNFSNVINQDTTLVAKYTAITYNITYTMNGGNQPSRTSYTIEDTPFTIPSVSRSNYEFDGWSGTDISSYVKTITITSSMLGDKSYTANWTRLWTVTFSCNGSTYTTRNARNNEAVSLPSNPSVAGKQFNYWTLNDVRYTNQAITSNVTLVAYLTDDVYTVNYYANGSRKGTVSRTYGEQLGDLGSYADSTWYDTNLNCYDMYSCIYNDLSITLFHEEYILPSFNEMRSHKDTTWSTSVKGISYYTGKIHDDDGGGAIKIYLYDYIEIRLRSDYKYYSKSYVTQIRASVRNNGSRYKDWLDIYLINRTGYENTTDSENDVYYTFSEPHEFSCEPGEDRAIVINISEGCTECIGMKLTGKGGISANPFIVWSLSCTAMCVY